MEINIPSTAIQDCSTSYYKVHIQCDRCCKVFPTRGSLNRHIKTHTKPYVCKHCGKGFSLSTGLDRHSTQHRNFAILFKCHIPGCQVIGFVRKDNLRRHIKTHHEKVLQQDTIEEDAMKNFCNKASSEYKQLVETSSILMAAETENENLLHSLSNKYGSNLESKSTDGKTALHIAVAKFNVQCACILLDAGADVEAFDSRGDTALHYAAYAGRPELLQLLFESQADINKRNYEGLTPLHICAKEGHALAAKCVLQMGVDINATLLDGTTALHLAVTHSNACVVELLLENSADVNAKGRRNKTPLMLAVTGGHENLVQLLLDYGADLHIKGVGVFPLRRALLNGHEAIMKLLLERGADLSEADGSDPYTWSCAMHCTAHNDSLLALLLKFGASPNVSRTESRGRYRTVLESTIRHRELTSTRLLFKHGASLKIAEENGRNMLEVAVQSLRTDGITEEEKDSSWAIVKLLLDHGADIKSLSQVDMDFVNIGVRSKFPCASIL